MPSEVDRHPAPRNLVHVILASGGEQLGMQLHMRSCERVQHNAQAPSRAHSSVQGLRVLRELASVLGLAIFEKCCCGVLVGLRQTAFVARPRQLCDVGTPLLHCLRRVILQIAVGFLRVAVVLGTARLRCVRPDILSQQCEGRVLQLLRQLAGTIEDAVLEQRLRGVLQGLHQDQLVGGLFVRHTVPKQVLALAHHLCPLRILSILRALTEQGNGGVPQLRR
mmetsp:Transcript_49619/g.142791  ORF Transcript_49619/g.142791 Transcript_49619/m.142791 type:complete len:222 (-) Transcript_49619:535-1200(-)